MGSVKLPMDEFLKIREEILKTWPTGQGLTLENGIEYQQNIPEHKQFALAMKKADAAGETLIQPRAGVALVDEHIALLNYLETVGKADLLPSTIDAYTRLNRYDDAAKGIEKSIAAGTSRLNGFPAVNHGLEGCRRVVENVNTPIQVRHGTPDARLLTEITLASGFTSYEGGGISYNIPYAKRVPIRKCLEDWQYVDRLVGIYEENGVSINREPFGPLTGTLVPPCVSHAVAVLEGLLALEQGARSLTLGYGQAGNMVQDIAAMISLRELADEYFQKRGFDDYELSTVFHQWMGGFPHDESEAFAVICWGATVASMSKATKVIVKTPHEASGIPTKEANTQGLLATRQAISLVSQQGMPQSDTLRKEVEVIKAEVRCLLDHTIETGRGDLVEGIVAGFESGTLDIPFAPSVNNHGKILPVRDNQGFVRILNKGNLPLSAEVLDYHREKLEERAKFEKRDLNFQMVTDDIYAISKGKLIGRPNN